MSSAIHPDVNQPHPSGNRPSVTAPALPAERKSGGSPRKFGSFVWIGAAIFLIAGAAVGIYFLLRYTIREPFTGPTWTVVKQKLQVTIVERGSLESAENSDIVCRIKAGQKGSTSASTIKWVVDDGTQVKAGDPLIDLDDSGFQESLKTQRNVVAEALSKWIEAKTNCIITESQNESDIKTAEVKKDLAELDLKKLVGEVAGAKLMKIATRDALQKYLRKGFEADVRSELTVELNVNKFTSVYFQTLNDLEGRIETARSDREQWLDKASWSLRMVQKGFYSRSQADSDQSRLAGAEITLRKAEGDLEIFRRFTLERDVTNSWSEVKETERAFIRAVTQANSKIEKDRANETSKKAVYDQEVDRLRDMEKEEKNYRIISPQDGMVVYFIPEQSRTGGGTQQAIVAQGEPVREGQKLIRIPNLARMMVNVRVHEAMVSKVKGERTKPTGYGDRLRVAFSVGRNDLWALAAYQFAFEELRDDYFKDKEQITLYPGQKAAIRIDAYPGKQYYGNVKTVATVASQADFFSSDVKVYTTLVSINSTVENLKPGMSAEVTILADETTEPVLVIPIQSVVGNIAMGAQRKCFVVDANGMAKERDIKVGMSNDKLVQVLEGLEEGENVVQNPRPLIPEKSDMKPGTPGTRRGAEFGDDPAAKKGKKKGDGAKPGSNDIPPVIGQPGGDAKKLQRPEGVPVSPDRLPGKSKM